VGLALALRIGRLIEAALGASVDSRIAHRSAAGNASASVTPLWLAVRVVGRRGRLGAGLGLRGGLAVIAAEGTSPEGAYGSLVRFAALAGIEARLRWHFSERVAIQLEATADLLQPHQLFTLGGTTALDAGAFAVGLGLGLATAFP
jgi:hypothetical protein